MNIVPTRWMPPQWAAAYEQFVFVDWLEVEVPQKIHLQEVLQKLSGWRNREVYNYIKSWDWTAQMYDNPIPIVNLRWRSEDYHPFTVFWNHKIRF